MKNRTKFLTAAGMLTALSFIMVAFIRIPIVPGVDFLKYEPKDVAITLGGLIFGPAMAAGVTVATAFIELVTISSTGLWGFLMNVIASLMFSLPVAFLYRKKPTLKRAILGLGMGILAMTASMLLWNYLITPIYMGYPRSAVAGMLIPVFLPFNLIKSAINAVITFLLYKPLVTALRRMGYIEIRTVVSGTVVHGKGVGKTIGFPTANLELNAGTKLPPKGVYATSVLLEGKEYRGITNVGTRPTVDSDKTVAVETYILDFDEDIYGKRLEIRFLKRLRSICKFEGMDALKEQMTKDMNSARQL